MSKFNDALEKHLLPVASKLGSNKILISMRDGIIVAMPLIIIGSLFLVISGIAIPGWIEWLEAQGIQPYLMKAVNGTFGLMGLVASFGVAHSIARQYNTDGVSAGIIAMSAFLVVTPNVMTGDKVPEEAIPQIYMGSQGLFVALIIGIISGLIFQWFINRNIRIKMPDQVPPAVAQSFSALIPGAAIIILWLAVYIALDNLPFGNIHELIVNTLGVPLSLMGGSLIGTIILVGLNSAFWFVGIHGANVVNAVMQPIWLKNIDENRLAYQANPHGDLPHIITQPFIDNFVFMGGGGSTIGLVIVIAILAFKKRSSKITKTMAPLTLMPGIFNINEPTLFGLPVVLNVRLIIPFVLAPMINATITYFAMSSGLVHLTNGTAMPWTIPPIISGFLATGHYSGSLVQIVCIIIDILLYYPFYRAMEKYNLYLEDKEANGIKETEESK
ncbi:MULTISPECIES: PTS sugar transporter subunit IIC [Staphylococcus]|uniref:Permease IIC component n=3 Tax=Staphylococcus equorum TaxID=246432 RepID=A0AAP7LUV5_9STAP|nr:PTS sugar transporter subunit IIC [Staphylococcus equorum]ALM58103.1 PTS cellobiose transporter subunit IIC [Staphylococcus equorum]ANR69127.1 PTS cellobiose transporter subunit IIC [Staphylococcus equorum]ERH35613.1 PTS cellobiose transporter subunit IIC [Staphylococcus equorum UMC-CNS-924]KKI53498.1 PTS system, cellobiose-specific IIC component [Staphylococcus equorum subsp. equorum]MCE5046985.1 PTS sugar transporter subunit IIC [Staphylococcus equorum]